MPFKGGAAMTIGRRGADWVSGGGMDDEEEDEAVAAAVVVDEA